MRDPSPVFLDPMKGFVSLRMFLKIILLLSSEIFNSGRDLFPLTAGNRDE